MGKEFAVIYNAAMGGAFHEIFLMLIIGISYISESIATSAKNNIGIGRIKIKECKNLKKITNTYVLIILPLLPLGDQKICLTTGCKDAANLIQNNIDENEKPCNDFYNFACGGFIKKSKISDKYLIANHIETVQDKVLQEIKDLLEEEVNSKEPRIFKLVKSYYTACMDEASIEKNSVNLLLRNVDKLGGWPVLDDNSWDADKFDVFETDYKLREIGYLPRSFFDIYVFNDLFNTSRNFLHIDAPEAVIKVDYFKRGFYNEIVQAYYHYMVDVAVLLGANRNRASRDMKKVFNFERDLITAGAIESKTSPFNLRRISDLEKDASFFPWAKYINHMTKPIYHFYDFSAVNLLNPGYLISLEYLLNKTPKKVIANYMIWKFIEASTPYLTQQFRDKRYEFKKAISEKTAEKLKEPRWIECINMLTNKDKGLIVGTSSMYIKKYVTNDTKKDVNQIVSAIINGFKDVLKESTWMDDISKTAAIRKVELMRQIIGYPDELLNDKIIDEYSNNLNLHPNSYFQNFLNLQRFHFDYMLFGLTKLVNETLWPLFSDSTTVNAYYYAPTNIFVLLAALLQPPLYNSQWPSYAKFGSVGFIISHEMMHAFDSKRYSYDAAGNFQPWMSQKSKTEYENRATCILEQYETFTDQDSGNHVDGSVTLNENIADNGAVKIAYYAYKNWVNKNGEDAPLPGLKYTSTQLFWINLVNFLCSKESREHRNDSFKADKHTPDDFRAFGMITNSPDFAKAFKCPRNSLMNPSKKCEFW